MSTKVNKIIICSKGVSGQTIDDLLVDGHIQHHQTVACTITNW